MSLRDGTYEIRNVGAEKYFDLRGGNVAPDTNIIGYSHNGNANQKVKNIHVLVEARTDAWLVVPDQNLYFGLENNNDSTPVRLYALGKVTENYDNWTFIEETLYIAKPDIESFLARRRRIVSQTTNERVRVSSIGVKWIGTWP
ncbi:hypothetical protein V8E55_010562 [Tylopilus felleus]